MPTWPIAFASFVLGFAVADVTGVRPLGGAVLLVGGVWCVLRWLPRVGAPVAIGLTTLALVLFVLSHPLGDAIGTWPAVLLVAAIAAGAAWRWGDRGVTPHAKPVS
jgi:hypothetical protein